MNREGEKVRVTEDLKRLRGIEGLEATIAAGAKLIGDEALVKEMTPPKAYDVFAEQSAWQRSHPYPRAGDPADKKRAFAEAQLAAAAEWIAQARGRIAGYAARRNALEMLKAPTEQIVEAAEDEVRVARTDDRAMGASFIANVVRMYVTRGIQLDRVPALVEEVVRAADDPEGVIEIDLAPSPLRTAEARMNQVQSHVSALVALSECYEKQGQLEKARSVLAPVAVYLAQSPLPEGVRNANGGHNLLLFHGQAHHDYAKRMAELDERGGRQEEALREYREALEAFDGARDNLLAKQRQLWKELGRTDEAWQQWMYSIPRPAWREPAPTTQAEFAAVNRALPKVALKDVSGSEWPAERMAKTTVAVVWATWCQPCVRELPYFARLAERLKDRADVQAVSFATDDNPETARLFLEKNGYSFVALAAKNFAEDLMPYFSIPRTWIIRDGAIVREAEGFSGDGDRWVERVLALVK
jgi:thiol-disulfide isomerase/thioredoxin